MCLSFRSLTDKEVVVRKSHMCGWCGYRVEKGERAQSRAYVFDGEFTSDRMHPECYNAMNGSAREVTCEGWMPGDFERGEIAA